VTRLVALGDSFSCGEGVGVRVPHDKTWTALLAAALPGASFSTYAAPGARIRDVRHQQLPQVTSATVATVLVGLNDVARSGFDAATVHRDLVSVVEQLGGSADIVLLGRLHDPARMLRLPALMRRLALERVAVVNAAVDEAVHLPRVHVLDLEQVEALHSPAAWAVDRLHPAAAGHAALALAAAVVLGAAGVTVQAIAPVALTDAASHRERMLWLAGHGGPYLARNLRALGTPVLEGVLRRI
jgi:lysophospholipase L1-like esterase